MKQFDFKKYCTPAQLYLVLAGIGLIAGFLTNFRVFTLLFHTLFVVLFAFLLNFLCKKGFTSVSWIIVLLPFVFMLCAYFLALDAADQKENEMLEGNVDPEKMTAEEKKQYDLMMGKT